MNVRVEAGPPVSAKEKRARLAERLRRMSKGDFHHPVSCAQERLLFLDQLQPNSPLYNVPSVARLTGAPNVPALERALQRIVARHETLRTRFDCNGETTSQVVSARVEFKLRVIGANDLADGERLIREEVRRPFNLAGAETLMRAALIRLQPGEHLLVLNLHHIVADEWSLKILFRELHEFYKAEVAGSEPQLPELPIQYADYAAWQREWLKSDSFQQQLQYWKSKLDGKPPMTELMTDRPRGPVPGFEGRTLSRTLGADLGPRLKRLASQKEATLFMVTLAAFNALIHRYTGLDDIIIGTPIAGRNRVETEGLIGFFVNTLLLRSRLDGDPTFEELLERVRGTALGAYAHQDLPFNKVVEALRPDRSLNHLPFTKIMFALQANAAGNASLHGLNVEWLEVDTGTAKFDMTFVVQDFGSGLAARVEYNSDLFAPATMERLLEHFENVLRGAADNPSQHLSELPLMREEERHRLLVEWNNNATDYPRHQCIHELFEARVRERPEAVAVIFGGETLTYRELNGRANQLARALGRHGLDPGAPAAICMERSAAMVVAMLAILKAGGAYVPMDPSYPKERLSFMLADTRASILLTQQHLLGRLPRGGVKTICMDTNAEWSERSPENALNRVSPEDAAYIIYTSGSTGQPKGVVVPHRAVNRLVLNTNYIELNSTDRIAQVSNISFDAATFEIWGALLNGGQLRGIATDVALSPHDFARELREQGITAMFLTSALFSQLAGEVPGAFSSLRTLIAGGESLDPNSVRAVLGEHPPLRLVNGYGPTENTTFTCCALLREVPEGALSVPIGRPISNTQVYILDPRRNPVPVGVPGELYTGGDGLARGYWNRPELTGGKFILHSSSANGPCHSLYRTGDLARYLPDGSIEFLGRIDDQVKVRGFRVELGEIEAVLGRHPGVRECAVTVSGAGAGQTRLVAYIVPIGGGAPNSSHLRKFLKDQLPEYMVPSAFVELEALPLTPNGKVDRRALPEPDGERPQLEKKYASPRDAVELELTKIWEEVLGIAPIGIEDHFFDLGGHSLLAVRLAARIEKAFDRKLRLATLFMAPTIEQLAAVIRDQIREGSVTSGTSLVELQGKGTRPPLFLVHGAGGGMFWGYVNLAKRLGTRQPVFGFSSRGLDGRAEFTTIEEMAAQYVSDLRVVQPRGPYHLGGYCFGGNVAYEMARRLEAQGEKVALLVLFNCAPPNSRYMRLRWTPAWCARFFRNLLYWADHCRQWTAPQRRDFLKWKWGRFKRGVTRLFGARPSDVPPVEVENLIDLSAVPEQQRELWQTHIHALMKFHPQPYAGRVHLFRSPGHPLWCSFESDYGWGEFARQGVAITVVQGAHEKILEEPWVNETAAELTNVLEASRESAVDSRKREMTPEEENLILVEWNRTEKDYPRDKTLIQLFLEQAARTPEAEALVCGTNRLTYRELSGRATSVARRLRDLGVGRDTLVGICLERSEDMVAGILGTLLAGGAYVPLDPAYPKTRLEFIVKDAEMRVVLTRRKLRDLLPAVETQFLCVEDLDPVDDQAAPAPAAGPRDLAYVLYTSGSTGQPKGVALEHRGAVALVSWAREVFAPDEISGVLASTSICFDLSVFELFVPLSWGGKIILADNALALPGLPAANEVTLINTVPSAIRELLRINGVPPSVRVINLAGEPLATALVDQIYRETPVHKVYDLYGPTETTTYSTFTLRHPGESPTIGRPLSNEQVYILDEQLQPVPIGTPGDLYIGGIGLARGYLNRPELTAERFLPNPFRAGTRLYKTGDIARWREDGNLVYLGRSDHQVKIRGFRIELAEIESALKSYSGVTDAVVIAREDRPGEKRLVAYIVASAGGEVAAEELRRAVREKLPDYMTPVSFVFLPKLPLTPNGKLDRNALPAPQDKQRDTNSGFVPPRTALEAQVAAIWSEVLGQDTVGATDDFFELGGNSLLAIQVISRLRSVFTVELPLSCLFETRTVESLASGLEAGRWRQNGNPVPPLEPIPRDRALPAAFIQEQLWFLNQLEPDSDAYNVPAAIRLKGRLDTGALQKSFDKILQRHDALRTTLHCSDGNLTQSVAPSLAVAIGVIDVPGRSEARMTELLQAEARRPFDLARGPLVRASLIRLDELDHALIIVMHHAVTDGWSLDIVFRELEASYQALAAGNPAPNFSALPVQYADFAFWQRRWMQGDVRQRGLLYWKENLAGAPLTLDLPTDQIGAVHPTNMAARVAINLPETLRAEVVSLARNEGGTNFMVLMTALAVALHKWTGQADMILGTVVAGRNRREVEGLVGCFMNFLPLRVNFAGLETGLDAFRTVKAKVIDGQTHQDCPFESMVESVTVERRPGRNPLYNVALLFQNSPAMPKLGHGLESSAIPVHVDAALLDLRFEANETADGIALMCEYKAELFHPATIDELLASFRSVLETLTRSPGTKIADFEMTAGLTRPQPQTIAVCGTFTAEPLEEPLRFWLDELEIPGRIKFAPYDQVFQQLLNPASVLSANHHGLNVLLIRLSDWESHPGAPEGQGPSTFGQAIKHNADEFVRAIHSATARGGAPILICFCPPPRRVASDPSRVQSLADLETALAVALAGLEGVCVTPTGELAALYPVADYDDPESEELGHIPYSPVFFTAVATLVARKFHALLSPPCKVIALDCDQTLWSGVCGEDGPRGLRLDAPRLALQKFMRRQQEGGKLLVVCSKNDEADVNAVFAEGAPMPLNREHFTAWRVNWRPKSENLKAIAVELKLGLDSFVLIDDNPVECAEVEAHCPEVLTLQLPEDPALIPQFLDHCWVFDQLKTTDEDRDRTAMYQQNRLRECFQTDAASFADFIASLEVEVQITPVEPAQLARVAQLTQRTNQFNASGRRRSERELRQLGGRREILTVSVRDRFGDYGLVGAMIFETGDGALVVDSFLLSCRALGRGVEHRMLAQLGKMARERGAEWVDIPFEKSPRNQPALDFLESVGVSFKQSHGHLHQFHFPADVAASVEFNPAGAEPSSPAASVRVNSRPAAAPRKFTRCRTIALESANVATIHERIEARAKVHLPAKGTYAAPRNQIERQLCELWQKILRVERVGIADDFFELGGHSLLAVRLFAEVEKTTGQKLPLVTLFQAPTVGELAAVLCQHQAPGSQSLLVPIQPHGSRPPLYLVHGAGGDVLWGYANLVAHMDAEQPIFALKSRGQTGEEEFHRLEDMAAFYVQALRAKQPDGPFYLGGYCFGGNVAYEMARQLQADGAQVALLALLDSAPANAGYQTVNWWRPEFPGLFARNIFYWLRDFRNVKPRDRRRFIARKLRTFGRKAARWMHGNRVAPEVDLEEVIDPAHFQAHELELWKIHLRALADHVQRPYPGTVTLFRTRGHPLLSSFAHDLRWGALAGGGVNLQMIPGSHENIFMEPHVETLAIRLTAALSEAQGRAAMENKPIALHS